MNNAKSLEDFLKAQESLACALTLNLFIRIVCVFLVVRKEFKYLITTG